MSGGKKRTGGEFFFFPVVDPFPSSPSSLVSLYPLSSLTTHHRCDRRRHRVPSHPSRGKQRPQRVGPEHIYTHRSLKHIAAARPGRGPRKGVQSSALWLLRKGHDTAVGARVAAGGTGTSVVGRGHGQQPSAASTLCGDGLRGKGNIRARPLVRFDQIRVAQRRHRSARSNQNVRRGFRARNRIHDLPQVAADGVRGPLGPLRVLCCLVAREHIHKALLGGSSEERGRVGAGDVGVELVGVELGEDKPVCLRSRVFVRGGMMRETRRVARRRKLRRLPSLSLSLSFGLTSG